MGVVERFAPIYDARADFICVGVSYKPPLIRRKELKMLDKKFPGFYNFYIKSYYNDSLILYEPLMYLVQDYTSILYNARINPKIKQDMVRHYDGVKGIVLLPIHLYNTFPSSFDEIDMTLNLGVDKMGLFRPQYTWAIENLAEEISTDTTKERNTEIFKTIIDKLTNAEVIVHNERIILN